MLLLKECIDLLEKDLKASPPRVSVYNDLPFAILRYDPIDEWELRRELRLLSTRLESAGREVQIVSLADLLWKVIEETEGIDAVAQLERQRGFEAAQDQVTTYLSDTDWQPLPDALADKLKELDPSKHIVFLTRAPAMAPAIYHMSKLLDEMQGRTRVTTILCYPGTLEGVTGLRFMSLKGREALGNYRVKVYG